jgi:hypothetical protein
MARTIGAFPCAEVAERFERCRWPLSRDQHQSLIRDLASTLTDVLAVVDRILDETA